MTCGPDSAFHVCTDTLLQACSVCHGVLADPAIAADPGIIAAIVFACCSLQALRIYIETAMLHVQVLLAISCVVLIHTARWLWSRKAVYLLDFQVFKPPERYVKSNFASDVQRCDIRVLKGSCCNLTGCAPTRRFS